MSRKVVVGISALCLAAAGGGLVTRLLQPKPAAPVPADVSERLDRIEASVPRLERSMMRAGARVGVAALAGAGPTAAELEAEGTPEGDRQEQIREQQHAERLRRHYDRLDDQVRVGGGAEHVAHLRRNIEAARKLPQQVLPQQPDIGRIDCGATVCRVEVRLTDPSHIVAAAQVLAPGMAGQSMRPLSGRDGIYYLGTPGHQLPSPEP
jgi:hypothetical protein